MIVAGGLFVLNDPFQFQIIAHIHNDYLDKFGIPRQSGRVETKSQIIFDPPYRDANAVRGLEAYSHLWLLWLFSENQEKPWSPTVRPPRLGGNKRVGVFATRSPYRPNPIGLSAVKIEQIEFTPQGPVLHVLGADLMNGTPILDIKPYLPLADRIPDAHGHLSAEADCHHLQVIIPDLLLKVINPNQLDGLIGILEDDPRPSYQDNPGRSYGFFYAEMEVHFTVQDLVLTVHTIKKNGIVYTA